MYMRTCYATIEEQRRQIEGMSLKYILVSLSRSVRFLSRFCHLSLHIAFTCMTINTDKAMIDNIIHPRTGANYPRRTRTLGARALPCVFGVACVMTYYTQQSEEDVGIGNVVSVATDPHPKKRENKLGMLTLQVYEHTADINPPLKRLQPQVGVLALGTLQAKGLLPRSRRAPQESESDQSSSDFVLFRSLLLESVSFFSSFFSVSEIGLHSLSDLRSGENMTLKLRYSGSQRPGDAET